MATALYKDWITGKKLRQITKWARNGLENQEIAKNIGITPSTFSKWIKKHEQIEQALKKGREQAISIIENAMFKKATGFYENDKYYPPDNVAMIYLLKNWTPEEYSDKPKTELEKEINQLKKKTIELQNEKLELENEIRKRVINDEGEQDKLDQLLKVLDNAETVA